MRSIVGIDEVGRGPLAGPVSVGIVVCKRHFSIEGITDSKLMGEADREAVYAIAQSMVVAGTITFGVYSTSAQDIDKDGIERAISGAISRGLASLMPDPKDADVVLDGRLRAPSTYRQQSIIHGDLLVPAISLAAIVAKVTRDRHMAGDVASEYPAYGFAAHKGYGTKDHIAAIKQHGPSPIHRMSFLSNIMGATIHA